MEDDSPKNANDWMPHFNHYFLTAREPELHEIAICVLVFLPCTFKRTVLSFLALDLKVRNSSQEALQTCMVWICKNENWKVLYCKTPGMNLPVRIASLVSFLWTVFGITTHTVFEN